MINCKGLNGREATVSYFKTMGYVVGDFVWVNADLQDWQAQITESGFRLIAERCKWLIKEQQFAGRNISSAAEEGLDYEWRLNPVNIEDGYTFLHKKAVSGKNIFYRANRLNAGIKNENFEYSQDIFTESDNKTVDEQWQALVKFEADTGLKPTAVLWSGGKSLHVHYKTTDNLNAETWTELTSYLCALFDADPAIVTLSRKMRLPGFPRYTKDGVKKGDQTLLVTNDISTSSADFRQALDKAWDYQQPFTVERFGEVCRAKRKLARGLSIEPLESPNDAYNLKTCDVEFGSTFIPVDPTSLVAATQNPWIAFHHDKLKPALARLSVEQQFALTGYQFNFKKVGSKLVGNSPFSTTNSSGTSFQVNTRTGQWICHASQLGGHIEQFLSEYQFSTRVTKGKQYTEFCQWLADALAVEVPEEVKAKPLPVNLSKFKKETNAETIANVIVDPRVARVKAEETELSRLSAEPTHVMNLRFLGDFKLRRQITFINAAMGTGKTELAKKLIAQIRKLNPKAFAMLPGYRKALNAQSAKRLGAVIINDQEFGYDPSGTNGVGFCADSFLLMLLSRVTDGCIMIFDEVEAMLSHMLRGKTCAFERAKILQHFSQLIRLVIERGGYIVAMEANLTDITVNLFTKLVPNVEYDLLVNHYIPFKFPITVLKTRDTTVLVHLMKEALEQGDRVAFVSSSQECVKNTAKYLQNAFPDKKILRIDGETSASKESQEFLSNPKEYSEVHSIDCLLLSPSVEAGADIKGGYYTKEFFYFNQRGVRNASQMLGRIRDDIPRIGIVLNALGLSLSSPDLTRSDIKSKMWTQAMDAKRLANAGQEDYLAFCCNLALAQGGDFHENLKILASDSVESDMVLFKDTAFALQARENCSGVRLADSFFDYYSERGYEISYADATIIPEVKAEIKQEIFIEKEIDIANKVYARLQASGTKSESEIEELVKKENKTVEEEAELEKCLHAKHLPLAVLNNPEVVEHVIVRGKNKLYKQTARLVRLLNPEISLREHCAEYARNQAHFGLDEHYDHITVDYLTNSLGITEALYIEDLHSEHPVAKRILEKAKADPKRTREYLGVTVTDKTTAMDFISRVFKQIYGVTFSKRKVGSGAKAQRFYTASIQNTPYQAEIYKGCVAKLRENGSMLPATKARVEFLKTLAASAELVSCHG